MPIFPKNQKSTASSRRNRSPSGLPTTSPRETTWWTSACRPQRTAREGASCSAVRTCNPLLEPTTPPPPPQSTHSHLGRLAVEIHGVGVLLSAWGAVQSVNVHFYWDRWSQLCHANDQSWREVLESVSSNNQSQLQSATAPLKNWTDGAAEVFPRPLRPGGPHPSPHPCRPLPLVPLFPFFWAVIIGHHLQSGYLPLMLISFCVKKKNKFFFCFDSLCAHIHYINAMKLNFTILRPCLFSPHTVTHMLPQAWDHFTV